MEEPDRAVEEERRVKTRLQTRGEIIEEFTKAIHENNMATIEAIILANKARINDSLDEEGLTILQFVCREYDRPDVVKMLIDNGAQANKGDNSRYTPLLYACGNSSKDTIKELIRQFANVNEPDDNGWTPLRFAVQVSCKSQGSPLRLSQTSLFSHSLIAQIVFPLFLCPDS
jgi:ankyrin repeat protein